MPIPAAPQGRTPRRLIRDQAYDAIQKAILDGDFKPGEVLDDAELQQWLKMSRTPIRQALYALTLEGLIETAPQAHTRVIRPRPEQAVDYLQAIGVLVVGATTLAYRETTPDDRAGYVAGVQAAVERLEHHDGRGFVETIAQYYAAVNQLNPNLTLRRLVGQSAVALGYNLTVVVQSLEMPWEEIAAGYRSLAAAWEQHDQHAVERATKEVFRLDDDGLMHPLVFGPPTGEHPPVR